MKLPIRMNRGVAIALLATSCLLAIAPAVEAGGNHGSKRYKREARWRWDRHDHGHHRVIVRDSGAGPVLAGLIGGIIVGTAVARSAPVVVHEREYVRAPRYRYWDPYCGEWYASLGDCREHCREHRHPRIVKVYDVRGGDCVRTLRWSDGAWFDHDDDGYDYDRHRRYDDRDWRD